MIEHPPLTDILASRENEALQSENSAIVTETRADHSTEIHCDACGASGDELDWFFFESPAWTWERLCGRAGVMAFCEVDQRQAGFFVTVIN